MADTELSLELCPLAGERDSRVVLRKMTATEARPKEMRGLLGVPSWWSDAPLEVALCVDGTKSRSCWLEVWDAALARTRERHLGGVRVRHEALAAQADDDR